MHTYTQHAQKVSAEVAHTCQNPHHAHTTHTHTHPSPLTATKPFSAGLQNCAAGSSTHAGSPLGAAHLFSRAMWGLRKKMS